MAKIDLAAQAKAVGIKVKTVSIRQITPTRSQEHDLARIYMQILRTWSEGCKNEILPEYRLSLSQGTVDHLIRDDAQGVDISVARVGEQVVRSTFTFRGLLKAWMTSFQVWHMRKFVSELKYATSIDLSTQMAGYEVTSTIDEILLRNVSLARDLSEQARGRIADIVFRGLQSRTPSREVAREINEALKLGRDRALRIARDQTQKLSSALDRERQLQVGMSEFEWRHSGKKHFRPEHLARNGKVYSWESEVAKNDPPGFAPFCGCKAKGILRLD